jgi:cobalt/nickel transport system permease protein
MTRDLRLLAALAGAACLSLLPASAWAMHISEGILPVGWAAGWFSVALPFVAWGVRDIRRRSAESAYYKSLAGLMGAAVFVISCLPIPVPGTGSCAHPTGTGLAALFIGPASTVVIAAIALGLQALFLSHGGLSTLGANCRRGERLSQPGFSRIGQRTPSHHWSWLVPWPTRRTF